MNDVENPEQQPNVCGLLVSQASKAQISNDKLIARLFMRFAAIFGRRWTSTYPNVKSVELAKREWNEPISQLTMQELKRGVDYCKSHCEWPPALAEFLRYCREDNTLPTANQAFLEACHSAGNHTWSHPVVYHAAKDVGLFNLRTQSEKQTKPQFERAYEIFRRRLMAGEQLDVPVPKALPESSSRKSSPEVAAKYLKIMRDILSDEKKPGEKGGAT